MKYCNKDKILILALAAAIFVVGQIVKAETKKKASNWNSSSLSFFYNEQSKADLTKSLPESDIQPMTWPTEGEIASCRGVATEAQKEECINEIKECIKDEWIPDEITSYLLPLRKWAKANEHWQEKGKADVFLCRYCADNYLIQIMHLNGHMIITVREIIDTPPLNKDDHKNFVSQVFKTFWKGELSEMPLAQQQSKNVTKGGIRSGKMVGYFITDGKFVRFNMRTKIPIGSRMLFPDPYEPRFSDTQKSK